MCLSFHLGVRCQCFRQGGVSVCASLIELRSVVSKVKDQTMALQELNSQDYWSDRVLNNIQNLHRKCKQHKFDHQGFIYPACNT